MNGTNMTALFAVATIFMAGAGAVSPRSAIVDVPNVTAGHVRTTLTRGDTATFKIDIDPWRSTTYMLGAGNMIEFPAGSVCDPDKSSYGAGEWDKPCAAARRPITATVRAWLDSAGHPRLDFDPDIRFVPSVLPTGWVMLTLADARAVGDTTLDILSCAKPDQSCTSEAGNDSTMTTHRNAAAGQITRRIKHFSGYMVGAGTMRR